MMNWESVTQEAWILLQALIALILGGLLGWERESAGKGAGLRTHMLVSLTSVVFIRLGQLLVADSAWEGNHMVQADPARIIEAIVAGISFLGAGTIFRDRSHSKATGLTTAASLLAAATIGIAVGIDRYVLAAGVTLLCLLTLRTLNRLSDQVSGGKENPRVTSAK